MATPTFPASLPAPLISGYGYKDDAGNVSRSPKSFGYQTQTQIGSTVFVMYFLNFVLSQSEMDIFEDFYKTDLLHGHKFFYIDLKTGVGTNTYPCRLTSKYQASLAGVSWAVQFEVETDVKNLMSQETYDLLEGLTPEEFEQSVDYLWQYVQSYPSAYTSSLFKDSLDESLW